MNDYTYEIEYTDGYTEELIFSAANLVIADELLNEYLEECCVSRKDIRVVSVEVTCYDGED